MDGGWPCPRRLLAALVALTVVRLVVAAAIPLTPDEAYYWVWSRALAPGYLDHPPMVALWIRAGTALAGQGALGIRLLGPLSALAGSLLVYRAALDLLGDAGRARLAVLLLNASLLFGVGCATMTPDTPLLFFWTAGLWAMARLIATGQGSYWLAAGLAAGCAMDSKYTGVLLPAGIALWAVACDRPALRRPWPWLGALLAGLSFAPVLAWNAGHHWASLAKQGGRTGVFDASRMAGHLGELIGGQFALATPIIFVLCVAGAWAAARQAWWQRDRAATLLACLILPGAAIFVQHALGDRVQANWPAILYPAAVIATGLASPRWRAWAIPGCWLGAAITALVYVQAAAAPLPLSRHLDPTLRLAGGYAALAADLQAAAAQTGASFVALDDYGPAALVAALAPACRPVIAIEPRWALFARPPGATWMAGQVGLLLHSTRRRDPPDPADWASLVRIGQLTRARAGRLAETYTLYRGIGRAGSVPAALMPCPHGPQPSAPPG